MTYLFVTQDDLAVAETYAPDAGENALIVQPGGRIPRFLVGSSTGDGPSLWRRGATWAEMVPVELHIDLSALGGADERALGEEIAWQEAERNGIFCDPPEHDRVPLRSYVGGKPLFWQAHVGVPEPWQFFFQLDGGEGWGDGNWSGACDPLMIRRLRASKDDRRRA